MLVRRRNSRISGGWADSTSPTKYSAMFASSPAMVATRSSASPRPSSAMANNRRPAAHPSVRSTSDLSAGSDRTTPCAASSAAVSSAVNARSSSAHLAECPGQAVAVQRQRRIPTSHQDHPEVLVGVPQQRVEVFGQLPVVQDRNAVEDEDDGRGLGGQVGSEPREHGTRDGAGAGRLVDRRGERDATAAEPLDEVRPEDGRLVVAFLEGYPHDGAGGVSGGHPRGDELGLATAGRPGHRCQGIADGLGDPVEEAASHHHERRGFGHGELRGVQRVAFGRRHTPGRGKNRQVARHVSLDRGYGSDVVIVAFETWHRVPHRPHGVVDAEVRRRRPRGLERPQKVYNRPISRARATASRRCVTPNLR